jgi:hypothetical protein
MAALCNESLSVSVAVLLRILFSASSKIDVELSRLNKEPSRKPAAKITPTPTMRKVLRGRFFFMSQL